MYTKFQGFHAVFNFQFTVKIISVYRIVSSWSKSPGTTEYDSDTISNGFSSSTDDALFWLGVRGRPFIVICMSE